MSLRFLVVGLMLALGVVGTPQSFAQTAPETASQALDQRIIALGDLLQMAQVIEIMREEGLKNATALETDMFPGQGGDRWQAVADQIYDPASMRADFDATLLVNLHGDDARLTEIETFFASPLGVRVVMLEIEARRALLDPAVEDAAKVVVQDMAADRDARLARLQAFAEVNDLIESNVMGALNANLAFYRGLAETVGPAGEVTEEQMLTDVWSQEADIRAETEDWLFPFLALAYRPLSDEDLAAYYTFSESAAGQKVNAALFAAFDSMFTGISRDLGRAAALQMQGQQL